MNDLLIAEDDEDIAAVLALMLQKTAMPISWVADGVAALETIVASPPAVLLTDIGMPGMGGWELIWAVRGHEHLAEIPIVVLTGYPWNVHTGAVEHGACAVLLKPCPGRELTDIVESLAARGSHAHCPTSTICLDPSNFSV
ncbi:CheY-like chemotaxis protein [Actinoplanes lutulentus]|uniref:Response regulator receiver domain-containing protein n=1 Tax=Actinoplanes lutulentus TaxID=1287878 RepID=A0A327Z6T0_9ACTN|nr:response regulator [Actinoplanes lutulentus]MBB2949143.1 CheY-like chemotaxis protein [Actinoplanes lutulentus]RAK31464.1 response regulator receiver domain-containing protein [Actinoplanes lutulentus]